MSKKRYFFAPDLRLFLKNTNVGRNSIHEIATSNLKFFLLLFFFRVIALINNFHYSGFFPDDILLLEF